jgi:hypothetical protein
MLPNPREDPQGLLTALGRRLLRRLDRPLPTYEKRIVNNMESLYRVIRPGDVLLVEGRSRISQIIQVLTKSSWSHAALYVGDRLKDSGDRDLQQLRSRLGVADRPHLLVEAEAGSGVAAAPLRKYKDYNIRICRPFGIEGPDLDAVVGNVAGNLGRHYDHENLVDLALLVLPSFLNPFRRRTIQACLGGCSEYRVICSGLIARAFQAVGYPIVPALVSASDVEDPRINDPYGSKLVMRHYSRIVPRDFDLSPNFEILKYNIVGLGRFDYRSIWAEDRPGDDKRSIGAGTG